MLILTPLSAWAQWNGKQQPNYRSPPTKKTAMSAPERFSDIPDYTGKKTFVRGTKYDKEFDTVYLEIWHVQEPRAQVVDWYKAALNSRGWQVNGSGGSIRAFKKNDRDSVSITVNQFDMSGARCELVLQAFRKK